MEEEIDTSPGNLDDDVTIDNYDWGLISALFFIL